MQLSSTAPKKLSPINKEAVTYLALSMTRSSISVRSCLDLDLAALPVMVRNDVMEAAKLAESDPDMLPEIQDMYQLALQNKDPLALKIQRLKIFNREGRSL